MKQSRFGKEFKPHAEKVSAVQEIFSSVANKYDLMNDLMSGGFHRAWKRNLVADIARSKPNVVLDMAAGTGDITARLHRQLPEAEIIAIDINESMLSNGRDRHIDEGRFERISSVVGSAEAIPLPDRSVDAYVISFGLRNVGDIDLALREAYRVLRPGGHFYCLEFSPVQSPLLKKGYSFYAANVIPALGELIAKDRASYQYLVDSIETFCTASELKARMTKAGFIGVYNTPYLGGVVQCHVGRVSV